MLLELSHARKVADYASDLGVENSRYTTRPRQRHLGAAMADAILQAGLNYRTVVYPRVVTIVEDYPEAATLTGVRCIVDVGDLGEFLRWKHHEKIQRFRDLVHYFDQMQVETTDILRVRLGDAEFQSGLLTVPGIGKKTVDYLACLVGLNTIAVDRHIKAFCQECGVNVGDYDTLRSIFLYASGLLDLPSRDFDGWVWEKMTERRQN